MSRNVCDKRRQTLREGREKKGRRKPRVVFIKETRRIVKYIGKMSAPLSGFDQFIKRVLVWSFVTSTLNLGVSD